MTALQDLDPPSLVLDANALDDSGVFGAEPSAFIPDDGDAPGAETFRPEDKPSVGKINISQVTTRRVANFTDDDRYQYRPNPFKPPPDYKSPCGYIQCPVVWRGAAITITECGSFYRKYGVRLVMQQQQHQVTTVTLRRKESKRIILWHFIYIVALIV